MGAAYFPLVLSAGIKKQDEKLSSISPLNLHISKTSVGFLHVAAFVGLQSIFVSQGLGLLLSVDLTCFLPFHLTASIA